MAGTASAIGALAVASAMAIGVGAVGTASIHAARVAGIADAAALAAADAATGAVSGVPCERAAEVAASAGGELAACTLTDMTAVVRVRLGAGLLVAEARARAGPAGSAAE